MRELILHCLPCLWLVPCLWQLLPDWWWVVTSVLWPGQARANKQIQDYSKYSLQASLALWLSLPRQTGEIKYFTNKISEIFNYKIKMLLCWPTLYLILPVDVRCLEISASLLLLPPPPLPLAKLHTTLESLINQQTGSSGESAITETIFKPTTV